MGANGGAAGVEETDSAGGSGGAAGQAATLDGGSVPDIVPDPPALLSGQLNTDFARALVLSEQGKDYIVQNNNWAGVGTQRLSYVGPSFSVTTQTGTSSNGAPVSLRDRDGRRRRV